jgi:hypothetical protein
MAADHSFGARPNSRPFRYQTESFRPVLLTTCLSVVILTLLIAAGKPVLRNMKPQSTPQPSS